MRRYLWPGQNSIQSVDLQELSTDNYILWHKILSVLKGGYLIIKQQQRYPRHGLGRSPDFDIISLGLGIGALGACHSKSDSVVTGIIVGM